MGDGGAPAGPKSGDLVGGMYRVGPAAGRRGDMNAVVARNTHTNEFVEIAFYSPDPPRELTREERGRFLGEARAAAKLAREHVVRVLDVGSLPDGSPYIVSQYFEGEDLGALLSRRGRVPVSEALLYGIQICEALAEAHGVGLVHGDLQPSAILLAKEAGRTPTLKLRGFGVAKPGRVDRRSRASSRLDGSPWYMSPEQLEGSSFDTRADVWSVGIILHELVTGEVPFDGPSATAVVTKVVGGVPEIRRDLLGHLEPIVRRCLARDPSDRYTRVGDLLKALRAPEGGFSITDAPPKTLPSAPPMVVADEELEFVGDADVSDDASEVNDADVDDDYDDDEVAARAELVSAIPPPARVPDEATTPLMPPVSSLPGPRSSSVPPARSSSVPANARRPVSDKVPSAKARAAQKAASERPAPSEKPGPARSVTTDRPPKPRAEEPRAVVKPAARSGAAATASGRSPLVTAGAIAVVAIVAAILFWRAGKDDRPERPVAEPTPATATAAPVNTVAPPPTEVTAATPGPTPAASTPEPALGSASAIAKAPAGGAPAATPTTAPAVAAPSTAATATASAAAASALVAALVPKATSNAPTTAREKPAAPTAAPATATTATTATPAPAAASADDDATVAFQVARQHTNQLKATCWDNSDKTTMVATVTATVEQGGTVRSVTVASTDVNLSRCIEGQVRTWTYPPSSTMRALRFPIRFRR